MIRLKGISFLLISFSEVRSFITKSVKDFKISLHCYRFNSSPDFLEPREESFFCYAFTCVSIKNVEEEVSSAFDRRSGPMLY